jgi:hypothetical protein
MEMLTTRERLRRLSVPTKKVGKVRALLYAFPGVRFVLSMLLVQNIKARIHESRMSKRSVHRLRVSDDWLAENLRHDRDSY